MIRIQNNIYEDLFQRIAVSKTLILSCKALSFIKPEFVFDVFYRLKEDVKGINDPILNEFYIYFEKEYILNYEVDNWNYYLQKKHFTNNSCEIYNSKLLRLFDYKKPSFWQNIQNRIHNLLNSDSISFYSLRLRKENEIEDISAEICIGMKDVDEDVFEIYIEFSYEKAKILSNYV